jgi:glycosyltransferase involved in cell wall biosynthesis
MTIALLAIPAYRRVPTVISIDATPRNIDSLADAYSHRESGPAVEKLKKVMVRRALREAKAFVSWSEWAKESLVKDYGVPANKVLVVAPGTNVELFRRASSRRPGLPRILFVGGDFIRKGGDVLLEAFRTRLRGKAELHIVTGYPVAAEEGIFIYKDLKPNSDELLDLFRHADMFALPTRADCLAVVLGEAMAASLPIVTTQVGAHGEAVRDGETGFVIPPDDGTALADALETLVDNRFLREGMGENARFEAESRFDAYRNALKVVDLMRSVAGHQ